MSLIDPVTGARAELDGGSPGNGQLLTAALDGYGHFTAMQVRASRVRGLDLHLARLGAAHQEMFAASLDPELVRSLLRHALGPGPADASARVLVRQPEDKPMIMITVRPPAVMPGHPWRLRSVPYQRPAAHLKHLGDFGQAYFQRQVHRDGFDEALLTGAGGVISEGSVTNVGFFDGTAITWPDAPVLAGITMQLLDRALTGSQLTTRRGPVLLSDLPRFSAVFVTNARGIAPVGQVDGVSFAADDGLMRRLHGAYESVTWDDI